MPDTRRLLLEGRGLSANYPKGNRISGHNLNVLYVKEVYMIFDVRGERQGVEPRITRIDTNEGRGREVNSFCYAFRPNIFPSSSRIEPSGMTSTGKM